MAAEATWLVLILICGLMSAIVAHSKGRIAVAWFLIGVAAPILGLILVTLASDLKRIASLEDELNRLRQELKELRELRFDQAVTVGVHPWDSICSTCSRFHETFSICAAFGREIREPVVVCPEFSLEVRLDEE